MDQEILQQTKQEVSSLMEQGKYEDALPLLRQAAHWGDVESQMLSADIYLDGMYGIRANPYAAFEYVKLAALNDQPDYMAILGTMFLEGKGTQKDLNKAFYFLKKAADRQVVSAYDPLAMMYAQGKGCQKDLKEAAHWIEQALEKDGQNETVQKHAELIRKLAAK